MLLSIIMPVYRKPEPLLRATMETVLRQTETDFELLAVNDASPDDAGTILAEYAARDPRVKILTHAVNRGVSAARNTALDAARGDYFGFLDADDRILPDYYATLLAVAKKTECDMVIAEHYVRMKPEETLPLTTFTLPAKMPPPHRGNIVSDRVIWNRIYRRSALGALRFAEGLSQCEDLVYVNAAELSSAKTVSIAYAGYGYCDAHGDPDAGLAPDEIYAKYRRATAIYLEALRLLADLRREASDENRAVLSYLVLRRILRFCSKTRHFAPEKREEIWSEFRTVWPGLSGVCDNYLFLGALAGFLFSGRYHGGRTLLAANLLRMLVELNSPRILMQRLNRERNLRKFGCDVKEDAVFHLEPRGK